MIPKTNEVFKKRYVIHETLGQGGMGVVCAATDRLTGKQVALKRLLNKPKGNRGSANTSERLNFTMSLAQEFEVLAALRHPHIIEVLDYGFDDLGQPFFTMELLENAQSILEAGHGQPILVKIELLVQVLQALAYLHRHNLLHRDIKPNNILVVEGKAKLVDFGLTAMQNKSDTIMGTIAYMSPELLYGQPHSPASDLYAMGVVAYELFVGRHPFDATEFNELVLQIMQTMPNFTPFMVDGAPTVIQSTAEVKAAYLPLLKQDLATEQVGKKLSPIVSRLLEKDADKRYRNPYDVIIDLSRAVGQPIPIETKETRDSFLQAATFVGREAELGKLTGALQLLERNQGNAWLVGGESGVGKSRLLNELRTVALVKGTEVLKGQAISEGNRPYQPWISILRWLALMNPLALDEAGLLHRLVPDLLLSDGEKSVLDENMPVTSRNIVRVLVSLLKKQATPVLILLEDLHWARDESLHLLADLLPYLNELPVMIVASYRDDETSNLPAMLPSMQLLELERLTEQNVAHLSRAMLGKIGQDDQLVGWLHRRSEGNVFFLIEVLRALTEENAHLGDLASLTIPPHIVVAGIEDMVQRRLSRVDAIYQPALKIVAILGRQLDRVILQMLDPYMDWNAFFHACAEAAVLEMSNEQWQFAHDKLREGILNTLTVDEASDLHRQVATTLEAIYAEAPEHSARLAYHWRMAGDMSNELHYTARAGEHALQVCAYQEAVYLFERALTLAEELGQVRQKIQLGNKSGEAHWRIGAYTITRERLAESLTLASATYDRKGMTDVLRVMGNINQEAGKYIEAVGYLTRSLSLARETGDEKDIADALRSLAVVMMILEKPERAKQYHHESLSLYRKINDYQGIMKSLHGLGLIARLHGHFDEAQQYHEQSLALGRQVNDRRGIALALNNLGGIALVRENYQDAERYQYQSLQIFKEIGDRHGVALVLGDLGYVAWKLDQIETGLAYFYDAVVEAFSIDALPVGLNILVRIATLLAQQARTEQALSFLGFILRHGTIDSKDKDEAQRLLGEIQSQVPTASASQLLQAGKLMSLEELFQVLATPQQ